MKLTIIAPDFAEAQPPRRPLAFAARIISKSGLSRFVNLIAWLAIEPQLALLGETRGRKKRAVTQRDIAARAGLCDRTLRRVRADWRSLESTHPEDAASLRAWWAKHGPTLLPPGTTVNQETITAALLTRQLTA